MTDTYIKSPLNYTGGKYDLLPHIIPRIPAGVDRFVDLFAGGFNVGINVDAACIIANDQIGYLMDIFRHFQVTPVETVLAEIRGRIAQYSLSKTNEEGYRALREAYNRDRNAVDLFVLTCYSFNHQIRFNSHHEFNTPFGKARSAYNDSIEQNLVRFCDALQRKQVEFQTGDFADFDFSDFGPGDFVYCDPPYLITTGSYNDGKRGFKDWTEREETQLLALLDRLNGQGVRFALSNVLRHKGRENEQLIPWSEHYSVFHIDKSYANCSYHRKDREAATVEVLITNYAP